MPVRSLSSPVLVWPDTVVVDRAIREWAREAAKARPEVVRIAYFGSYARGDWGVGSDTDIIIIVDQSDQSFERRAVSWDATRLRGPADVVVYTAGEWDRLAGSRFGRTVSREAVWVYERAVSMT